MKILTTALTYQCNKSCSFCSQNNVDKEGYKENPQFLVDTFDKLLKEHPEIESCTFLGGEPFIRPALLQRLVAASVEKDRNVSINTNLTLWSLAHTEWANANNLNIIGSSTGCLSGEKPLKDLDIYSIREIKNLSMSYVLLPGFRNTNWDSEIWAIKNILNCSISLYLDMHNLDKFTEKDVYALYNFFREMGKPSWIKIHKVNKVPCDCYEEFVLKPSGDLMSRGEYSNAPKGKQNGCSIFHRDMPIIYPILQELFA